MIDDSSHAGAKQILESPDNLLRFLDAEGVERACCINYVSPDVMGFTREVNDWIARFTKDHRDRLVAVGSVDRASTSVPTSTPSPLAADGPGTANGFRCPTWCSFLIRSDT